MRKRNGRGRGLILLLLLSILGGMVSGMNVQAEEGLLLTLDAAKKNGVANSPKLEKLESERNVKEVSLRQAVKSIKVKKRICPPFAGLPFCLLNFRRNRTCRRRSSSSLNPFRSRPRSIQSIIR